MKKAVITGITGQDGSYLAEYLISLGYEVHGLIRRSSIPNIARISNIFQDIHLPDTKVFLHYSDLGDASSIANLIYQIKPDEFYNLGAQSHVRVSFEIPEYTANITGLATVRILESIQKSGIDCKYYQASSSEMFGAAPPPQNEKTQFHPRSPYAIAKVFSYWSTRNYREAYNIFAANGILFNHESPRRGSTFVTRKITSMLANILSGKQKQIFLGNLDAKRDWGFAPEYVVAMHKILQTDEPDDFVLGTNRAYSVREFLEKSFQYAGIKLAWQGVGTDEKGVVKSIDIPIPNRCGLKPGDAVIEIDPWYYRPTEVDYLLADISKAKSILKWEPKISFDQLIKIMVDFDLANEKLEMIGESKEILSKNDLGWTNNLAGVIQV